MKPLLFAVGLVLLPFYVHAADFQAGAALVDVTPSKLPVIVNGGFLSRTSDKVNTRLYARALAVSDGKTTAVIVVTDSCMIPRPLADAAKELATEQIGIPKEHITISATHTHSAPSCMGALGTDADPAYVPYARRRLAQAIVEAVKALEPAEIGFGSADAPEYTALRRWIRRPDRVENDPFGNPTVRANMHAGKNPEEVTGESGPEDPELAIISVRRRDGTPLALLANFSMHYYGDSALSADYFGRFCKDLEAKLTPEGKPFVAMMSHGCSGDIWRRDYNDSAEQWNRYGDINQYATGLAKIAMGIYQNIDHRSDANVEMAERRMELNYRVPDQQRLEWAQRIVEKMGERLPKSKEEVYAREQVILHQRQSTEIVVQALRVGDMAIATTPNETYAITGLKLKAASPVENTMVIELANGGDGYIPPPEQHLFGGYNTWPARSAGLEVTAEPKITQACLELLEEVCDQPRRKPSRTPGPAAEAIAKAEPMAWWRMDEFHGPRAVDQSGNHHDAFYEPAVTYYLAGPHSERFSHGNNTNRAIMFAGGRMQARLADLGSQYSVSIWFWNGMPVEGREVAGWLFSRGHDQGLADYSEHLGIGGKQNHPGRLIFLHGNDSAEIVAGKTPIKRWHWHHVVFTRQGDQVKVYLDGNLEIETKSKANFPENLETVFFGGRSDNQANWEGRLDEISVFQRVVEPEELFSE